MSGLRLQLLCVQEVCKFSHTATEEVLVVLIRVDKAHSHYAIRQSVDLQYIYDLRYMIKLLMLEDCSYHYLLM